MEQITAKHFEAAREMAEKLREADFVPGALAKRAGQICEWYKLRKASSGRNSSPKEITAKRLIPTIHSVGITADLPQNMNLIGRKMTTVLIQIEQIN